MEFMCTKFSVDSSSRFSFKVRTRTYTQTYNVTDATNRLTHASATTGMHGSSSSSCSLSLNGRCHFHERPSCRRLTHGKKTSAEMSPVDRQPNTGCMGNCYVTAGHYYSQLMTTANASCRWPAAARLTEHGQLSTVAGYRPSF